MPDFAAHRVVPREQLPAPLAPTVNAAVAYVRDHGAVRTFRVCQQHRRRGAHGLVSVRLRVFPHTGVGILQRGVRLPDGTVAVIGEVKSDDGVRSVAFPPDCDVRALAEANGTMSLPPYIHERASRPEDYQTVYSKDPRSAAAPTAGLHFTPELLKKIAEMGVDIADITLEVGLGTFRPVKTEDIRAHHMHSERCVVPQEAYEKIVAAKRRGGRVIAVGTTVVRTLEGM